MAHEDQKFQTGIAKHLIFRACVQSAFHSRQGHAQNVLSQCSAILQ